MTLTKLRVFLSALFYRKRQEPQRVITLALTDAGSLEPTEDYEPTKGADADELWCQHGLLSIKPTSKGEKESLL